MENFAYISDHLSTTDIAKSDPEKLRKRPDKTHLKNRFFRQLFLCATITTGSYAISFLIGSTSMLPGLLLETSNISYTSEDLKWLASATLPPSIPANFLSTYLAHSFGPTLVYRCSLLLSFVLYITMALFPTMVGVAFTRVALFIVVGTFDVLTQPLITEFSEPRFRGIFAGFADLTTSFGVLLTFVSFTFVPGQWAIAICSVPVMLGFICSFFVPQSPYWLVERKRNAEALTAFGRMVGPNNDGVKHELMDDTVTCYEERTQITSSKLTQLKLLKESRNWKPLLLTMFIFACREFGGHTIIFFYVIDIVKKANIPIGITASTLIIGIVRVISTFFSLIIQDKIGRRVMLIGSTTITAFCMLTAGLVFLFEFEALNFIPLISIIVMTLMMGIGMGPVPFMLVGELISFETKLSSTAITFSFFNFYQFIIILVSPIILAKYHIGSVFIAFALINFVFCSILYFILPETKKKSLFELQNIFN